MKIFFFTYHNNNNTPIPRWRPWTWTRNDVNFSSHFCIIYTSGIFVLGVYVMKKKNLIFLLLLLSRYIALASVKREEKAQKWTSSTTTNRMDSESEKKRSLVFFSFNVKAYSTTNKEDNVKYMLITIEYIFWFSLFFFCCIYSRLWLITINRIFQQR